MSYLNYINTHTLNNNESRIYSMLEKYCEIAPITIEKNKEDNLIFGISISKADYEKMKAKYPNCIYYVPVNIYPHEKLDRVFLSVKEEGIETYRS